MSNPEGRPAHEPTDQMRKQAESMSGYGVPQEAIASMLEIDPKTLRKHYEHELALGKAKANTQIAKTLYEKAVNDRDTGSLIWWSKTQMGWSETMRLANSDGSNLNFNVNFTKPE